MKKVTKLNPRFIPKRHAHPQTMLKMRMLSLYPDYDASFKNLPLKL